MGTGRDLTGTVVAGRGLGAERLADPGTLERLRELIGFPVVPGTLNVCLSEDLDDELGSWYVAAEEIGPGWEAATGQAGYFLTAVLIADRYRGVAFQADEPGYPVNQIELLCEVHLRRALGLRDGDSITLSVLTNP